MILLEVEGDELILLEDLVALVAVVGLQLAASAEDKRVEPQVQESLPQVQPAGSRAHTSSGRLQVSPEETNFSETSNEEHFKRIHV